LHGAERQELTMNIGMIFDKHFPPDIRVEKEAGALAKAGHKIYIFSKGRGTDPYEEEKEDFTIVRFNINKYKTLKNFARDYKIITFINPVWKKGIEHFIKKYDIDAIHVHDLPFVKTAYAVAKKYGIPIIADYHENFPAHIQALSGQNLTKKERYYHSYARWAKYEENISHKVDRVIVVAEEYRQHLIKEHNVPPDNITIVQNTIDINMFDVTLKNTNEDSADEFILSYVGSYGPHRGLDVVIKAMPQVVSQIPNAKLVIVGRGTNQQELEKISKLMAVEGSVEFYEWVPYEKLIKEFMKASIGLIPHHSSEHTDSTIPNKLFEYMYFKTPLLVSDCPPLKRIIDETKSGIVFRAGDAQDFAEKVLEIYHDPDNYGEMGNKAVVEKYNWDVDSKNLVDLYKSVESGLSLNK
jgi:glycosyltransferase involved in cell wall biosynthesis